MACQEGYYKAFNGPGACLECPNGTSSNGTFCNDIDECSAGLWYVQQLVSGSYGYSNCAILQPGGVKCWGWNYDGFLGQGDEDDRGDDPGEMGDALPAVDLGSGRSALSIVIAAQHTCALLDDGSVKCWGANDGGQLGQGDLADRGDNPGEMGDNLTAIDLGTGRTAVSIAANGDNSYALLDDGSVKCWGENGQGQLGLGDSAGRGGNPEEMGDNLPAVNLGTGRTATSISVGWGHTCALLDDGNVKCWGYNYEGQLGQGHNVNRGVFDSEMGDNLPALVLGTGRRAVSLSAGGFQSCAFLDDGSVKCWGENVDGQLGQGDIHNRGDDPGEMGDNLPAISLGTGAVVVSVSAGNEHVCVLLAGGSIKCWGANYNGQLGQGDSDNRGDDPGEMGDNLPAIDLGTGRTAVSVSAGDYHTCAVLDDRQTVKCWGAGWHGQLGVGSTEDRGDNAGEMGDGLEPAILIGEIAKEALEEQRSLCQVRLVEDDAVLCACTKVVRGSGKGWRSG